jgi:hypothetical protein
MPLCYICERKKLKGEQCESCDSFFCDECVDAYCDGIDFDCDCYACNDEDYDGFRFMGKTICTTLPAQQQPQNQHASNNNNKKKHVGQHFKRWFLDNKLETYKTSTDTDKNIIFHFPLNNLIQDISEYCCLYTRGNKKVIIEQNLNMIYNCIVREYDPDEFKRYMNWIKDTIGNDFDF